MRSSISFLKRFPSAGLTLVLTGLPVCGLDPHRPLSQYHHERWGPERGFPEGAVSAITQGRDGYLWIGTETGLVRFDGSSFTARKPPEPTGLSIEHVLGLLPTGDGSLWLRLSGPTLVHYARGEFTVASPDPQHRDVMVTAMALSRDGHPLLASRIGGVSTFRGRTFESIASAADLPKEVVASIAQTAEGDIWLGTSEAGLIRLRNRHVSTVRTHLTGRRIQCLLPEPNGQLWVGTDRGLFQWDGQTIVTPGIADALREQSLLALTRDRDGNIWAGTAGLGLVRLNADGVSDFKPPIGGVYQPVTAVFEDREGDVWAGGAGGIERVRETAFISFGAADGLPPTGDGAVHADARGSVWWAPGAGGLYRLRRGQVSRMNEAGLSGEVIYSVTGRDAGLWLGRQKGGLTHLYPEGGGFKSETHLRREGLAAGVLLVAEENRDRSVWVGGLNTGASRFRNGVFEHYSASDGLAANTVTSIVEGSDGTTWFAGPEGLSSLSLGKWKVYGVPEGLPSKVINAIFEDSAGVIWLGTLKGLACFRAGRIQVPPHLPPALQGPIFGLAEDRKGALWVAASEQVVRVPRNRLLGGGLAEGEAREYGFSDGLQGVATLRRHRSMVADGQGRIWLSLRQGLAMVDPSRLAGYSASTIVHVESILVDGSEVPLQPPLRIPAGSRRVAIRFVGLNLSAPDRVRFRYALDGNDRGWNGPVSVREAIYTNLAPGPYRFRVAASSADGAWNGGETAIAFYVDPAFWQTWWFQLGGLLTFVLSVYVLYRVRLEQISAQVNIRFEERLTERTRIARELHDTLLQTLQGSRLLVESALSLPENEAARATGVAAVLRQLVRWLDQAADEGRAAVQSLRVANPEHNDLAEAFRLAGEESIVSASTVVSTRVEGSPRELHPLVRDEVCQVGSEAIRNACRHSSGTRIVVELSYGRDFRCRILDDGLGIPSGILALGKPGHFGLQGMRERAARINGEFSIASSREAGTAVALSVPGNVAYRHPELSRKFAGLKAFVRRRNSERR